MHDDSSSMSWCVEGRQMDAPIHGSSQLQTVQNLAVTSDKLVIQNGESRHARNHSCCMVGNSNERSSTLQSWATYGGTFKPTSNSNNVTE